MSNIKGSFRYWTPKRVKLLISLWSTERDISKILDRFPGKTYNNLVLKSSRLKISRLSKAKSPKLLPISLNKLDAAWLAGFMDGEGCIALYPSYSTNHIFYLYPRLQATNTNKNVIHYVKNLVGFGNIHCSKRAQPTWKDAYVWQTNSLIKSYQLLLSIDPYLRIKKPQSDLVKEFIHLRLSTSPRQGHKIIKEQQVLYKKILILNKKGSSSAAQIKEV